MYFNRLRRSGERLDSCSGRYRDGNKVEDEVIVVEEDTLELCCHVGCSELQVLAEGGAVAAGKEEYHGISVCVCRGVAFVE
jgi:hypothetical protein